MKKFLLLAVSCFIVFNVNVKALDKEEIEQFTAECQEITEKKECESSTYCRWNSLNKCEFSSSEYNEKKDSNTTDDVSNIGGSYNEGDVLSCGTIENIPARLPKIVSTIYNIIKIAVPIIIIIFGMLDMLKAVMAQKEDEIKKGQHVFLKRLLTGAIVFFVFIAVQIVIGLVSSSTDNANITDCMNCFLNNKCN